MLRRYELFLLSHNNIQNTKVLGVDNLYTYAIENIFIRKPYLHSNSLALYNAHKSTILISRHAWCLLSDQFTNVSHLSYCYNYHAVPYYTQKKVRLRGFIWDSSHFSLSIFCTFNFIRALDSDYLSFLAHSLQRCRTPASAVNCALDRDVTQLTGLAPRGASHEDILAHDIFLSAQPKTLPFPSRPLVIVSHLSWCFVLLSTWLFGCLDIAIRLGVCRVPALFSLMKDCKLIAQRDFSVRKRFRFVRECIASTSDKLIKCQDKNPAGCMQSTSDEPPTCQPWHEWCVWNFH